jgi:DNA-binding MarR family transcriptional regulator
MVTSPGAGEGLSAAIRLLARLSRVAETSFQETGISLPQYRLLVELDRCPRRPGEIAVELGVTRPTITSLVDVLVRNGMLLRVRVEGDRRGVRLETTLAGRQTLVRAEAMLAERLAPLLDRTRAAAASEIVSAVESALGDDD